MPLTVSIPQVGQPNNTEEPKITNTFTNLASWANGQIAASDISLTSGMLRLIGRSMGSSGAVNNGEIVYAAPGITVTLPAPVANGFVGIAAASGVTGASPVTVAGTSIYGEGAVGVSSFLLGAPQAHAILQSDGSKWLIIAGRADTGWMNLLLAGGVTGVSGYFSPQARAIADRVWLRGGMMLAGTINSGVGWGTLPVGTRPAFIVSMPAIAAGAATYLGANATGAFWCGQTITNSSFVVDGVSYTLT